MEARKIEQAAKAMWRFNTLEKEYWTAAKERYIVMAKAALAPQDEELRSAAQDLLDDEEQFIPISQAKVDALKAALSPSEAPTPACDEHCIRCDGEGLLWADGKAHYPAYTGATKPCPDCDGTGRIKTASSAPAHCLHCQSEDCPGAKGLECRDHGQNAPEPSGPTLKICSDCLAGNHSRCGRKWCSCVHAVTAYDKRKQQPPPSQQEGECAKDCSMCSGEFCRVHGIEKCNCDTAERHYEPERAAPASAEPAFEQAHGEFERGETVKVSNTEQDVVERTLDAKTNEKACLAFYDAVHKDCKPGETRPMWVGMEYASRVILAAREGCHPWDEIAHRIRTIHATYKDAREWPTERFVEELRTRLSQPAEPTLDPAVEAVFALINGYWHKDDTPSVAQKIVAAVRKADAQERGK